MCQVTFASIAVTILLIGSCVVAASDFNGCVSPDFNKMRIKELRAHLAQGHMDCFGCTEKHEFVSKALEAHEASTKGASCKPKAKADKKPQPQKRKSRKAKPEKAARIARQSPPDINGNILGLTMLFGMLTAGLWGCVGCMRRTRYRLIKQEDRCPITMRKVRDPYKLPCCRQVCERKAMGLWMAASKHFRKRHDGQLERVAQCPLCRTMMGPIGVRSLLEELRIPAPIEHGHHFDSEIPDPAYPDGAAERNFILLKTEEELRGEAQQQLAVAEYPIQDNAAQRHSGAEECAPEPQWQLGLAVEDYAPEANATQQQLAVAGSVPEAYAAPMATHGITFHEDDEADSDAHGSEQEL